MNDLFLRALRGETVERFPVWLMRQAGRYLPEYRELRKKHSLIEMFTSEELIEKVTLMPLMRIDFDAAILFSDITIVALALGLDLNFKEGIGPVITPQVQKDTPLKHDPDALLFVGRAIESMKKKLDVPLIGFCGAPYTVSCYLTETKPSNVSKKWIYQEPKAFHALLRKVTDITKAYLDLQIRSGVDAIQIFDSWAYILPKELYKTFSSPYNQELIDFVKSRGIPVISFARGSTLYANEIIASGPTAISFDWHESLSVIRKKVPENITIQGNFDPDLLYAPVEEIQREVKETLSKLEKRGHIINLGHGLKPDMDPDHVKCFVDAVKNA